MKKRGCAAVTRGHHAIESEGSVGAVPPEHRPAARAPLAAAFALCLLLAGCAPEPAATRRLVESFGIDTAAAQVHFAFTPAESAQARLGVLAFSFRVARTDNAGTCEAPIPDSSQSASPIYARVYREWVTHDTGGPVGHAVAETLWVTRGEVVSFVRRVPADTFLVNVRLIDAGGAGCRTYFTQIATPTMPGGVEILP
jgi:hypothetical protein